MHKLPNLYRNRLGTYYLRITVAGREIKRSLRTKEPAVAKRLALSFALARASGVVDLGLGRVQPSGHVSEPTESVAPAYTDTGRCNLRGLGIQDFGVASEKLMASTHTEGDMFHIPSGISRFDVQLPNGVKLLGITDDSEAQRAARFLLDLYGSTPSHGSTDIRPLAPPTAPAPTATVGKSKPFTGVARLYLKEKSLDNGTKTREDKQRTFDVFVELFGDMDFNAIGADQAIAFKQRLLGQALSIVRINSKLSHLNELFRWAVNNGLRHAGNPFESMRVSSKAKVKQQTQSYQPFTANELLLIFNPATYDSFMTKPDYRWLPWLAVHTGARIEELASLTVDQVRTDPVSGIVYLDIQKGKNLNSVRMIPLHSNVINAGFLDYVAKVKARGQKMVFPHLVAGKNGYSKNCSRRFAQYLDKIGIDSPQKTFHSFRSTFITRLSELNTHPAVLMAIVGHYQQAKVDLSSPHFTNYQGNKLLTALGDAVNQFDRLTVNTFTNEQNFVYK